MQRAWIEAADRPELVEYIVALDNDDESAIVQTNGQIRVLSPAIQDRVTAVRNWHAAAKAPVVICSSPSQTIRPKAHASVDPAIQPQLISIAAWRTMAMLYRHSGWHAPWAS